MRATGAPAAIATPFVAATVRIVGVVAAATTGRPLAHVLILVPDTPTGLATMTDSQGLYVLNGVRSERSDHIV